MLTPCRAPLLSNFALPPLFSDELLRRHDGRPEDEPSALPTAFVASGPSCDSCKLKACRVSFGENGEVRGELVVENDVAKILSTPFCASVEGMLGRADMVLPNNSYS